MNIDFTGKTVIVSGAAHGFGAHIAQSFAALGAIVHGCDVLSAQLNATAAFGVRPKVIDLTDFPAVTRWVQEISAAGPIDVLVNNAGGLGGAVQQPIEDVTDDAWRNIMEINVGTAFALSRAVATSMKKARAGAIVNISSGAGIQPARTGIQAYTAAKHAVVGLTRQLASELGPFGITVNSVAPGLVRTTASTEQFWASRGEDGQKAMLAGIAMRRLGTIEDIGNAVLFLASDKATWITGQILSVDGGK
jgi:3-oxoacyl-[acyl-carrier protein] reductase